MPPFRKLREEKTQGRRTKLTEFLYYDYKQMQAAFRGTVEILGDTNPYSGKVTTLSMIEFEEWTKKTTFKI